jgi:hypothetical protein
VGVLLERLHGGGVAEEFEGALIEGEVELSGEGGKVRGGGAEEALEGAFVADSEAVVEVLVLGMGRGGEGGFGFSEPGEGAVPNSDQPIFVIPGLTQNPSTLGRWPEEGGCRIKSGMTASGRNGARSA